MGKITAANFSLDKIGPRMPKNLFSTNFFLDRKDIYLLYQSLHTPYNSKRNSILHTKS